MGTCIAQRTGTFSFPSATMTLGTVLYQFQLVAAANLTKHVSIGDAAIKMNRQHGLGSCCDCLLHERNIKLEIVPGGFHQHGCQTTVGDGDDGGDIGVGGNDYLITVMEYTQLLVASDNKSERIQTVSHTNTVTGAHIAGIALLKLTVLLTEKIPARMDNPAHGGIDFSLMQLVDGL